MKRWMTTLLAVMLTLCIAVPGAAAGKETVAVYIDGTQVSFDVPPRLIGGRVMVPLRAIFERLGATVQWDEATRTVTAFNEAKLVKATINAAVMTVNGAEKTMDVPPMLVEERTLIPARFVAEALDCDVTWEESTFSVYITTSEIDYAQVEQGTTPSEEQPNNQAGERKIDYYWDAICPFPTYDSVTGAAFLGAIEGNDMFAPIARYRYRLSECKQYIECLEREGWLCFGHERNQEELITTEIMVKESELISITIYFRLGEVHILYMRK